MKNAALVLLVLSLSPVLAGCASDAAQVRTEPARIDASYEAVWKSAIDVVEERFYIERRDEEAGYILTVPKHGPSIFEFWATDASWLRDTIEETLHDVRRVVEVHVVRTGYDVALTLRVRRERKNLERPPTAFLTRYAAPATVTREEVVLEAIIQPTVLWTPVGRDDAMENRLIQDIRSRALAITSR